MQHTVAADGSGSSTPIGAFCEVDPLAPCYPAAYARRLEARWLADQRQIIRMQRVIVQMQRQLAEREKGEPLSVPR